MRKKLSVVIANRRRPSDFFDRVQEVFERKFDGFPAHVRDVNGRASNTNDNPFDIDIDDILKDIADEESGAQPTPLLPPCASADTCYENEPGCIEPVDGEATPCGPCSGKRLTADATNNDDGTYTTRVAASYIISVTFDGVPAVSGVDYSYANSVLTPSSSLDPSTIVSVTFVAA